MRAKKYLDGRGITAESCVKFAVGYAPDSWDAVLKRFGGSDARERALADAGLVIERSGKGESGFYDRFRDRVMFPIRDARGRRIAFGGRILDEGEPKYLNSPETALFHKGRELYGLYEARQALRKVERLLVVEGYVDVVRARAGGHPLRRRDARHGDDTRAPESPVPRDERARLLLRRRQRGTQRRLASARERARARSRRPPAAIPVPARG